MTNSKLSLYFFNVKGLGEPIRYLLAYAKIDYDDIRISGQEWPQLKLQMPAGKVPMLQIDSKKQLTQSAAILIYLGNEHGLAGKGSWEVAKLAEVNGMCSDVVSLVLQWAHELDADKKAKVAEGLRTKSLPESLNALTHIAQLDQGNKFVLDDKLTWADFMVAHVTEYIIDNFPQGNLQMLHKPLVEHLERVQALPGVKEYVAKRPQTEKESVLADRVLRSQRK